MFEKHISRPAYDSSCAWAYQSLRKMFFKHRAFNVAITQRISIKNKKKSEAEVWRIPGESIPKSRKCDEKM